MTHPTATPPAMARETGFGTEEGARCWRDGCDGVIVLAKVEGCSCHISAPCGACEQDWHECPKCEWRARDWRTENDVAVRLEAPYQRFYSPIIEYKPRPLDPRKIDYRTETHTHFTQKCVGVYPDGTTQADVEKLVRGTFGGRFNQFGNGRFEYIAYTD